MQGAFGGGDVEQGTLQLVMDQLEELIVTIIEEIRERPAVAAALFAAVLGALVGSALAARRRSTRRTPMPRVRAPRQAARVTEAAELLGLGLRLLENPLVRGYLRAMLAGQVRRRFSR